MDSLNLSFGHAGFVTAIGPQQVDQFDTLLYVLLVAYTLQFSMKKSK